MIRLAHRIAATQLTEVAPLAGCYDRDVMHHAVEQFQRVQLDVSNAVCFVVDNVCEYYFSHPQSIWHVQKDFPSCFPPFENLFIEWREPNQMIIDGAVVSVKLPSIVGCLIKTMKMEEVPEWWRSEFSNLCGGRWAEAAFVSRYNFVTFMQNKLHLICSFVAIAYKSDCTPLVPVMSGHLGAERCSQEYRDFGNKTVMGTFVHIPLLAMSFANCKNVVNSEMTGKAVEPDRPWVRKNNPPHIKYHVLNIEPMKQVLKTEGRSCEVGIQKALHLCRGHFAHYTEEKPLFGKYAGQFWVPQHVRGKAESGIVLKDYSIGKVS